MKPTLEGLKCMLAKPKVRKEPVTVDILKAMVEATGHGPWWRPLAMGHGGGHWVMVETTGPW